MFRRIKNIFQLFSIMKPFDYCLKIGIILV